MSTGQSEQGSTSVSRVLESDQEIVEAKALEARIQYALTTSRIIAWLCGITVPLEVILWLVFRDYPQLIIWPAFSSPAVIGAMLYPFLLRRGYTTVGIYLFLIPLLFALSLGVFLPALLPTLAIVAILIILLSCLLLGARSSLWLMGLTALTFTAAIVLANVWTLPLPALGDTIQWVLAASFTAFTLAGIGFIIRLIIMGQEDQFRQAQLANLEVERRVVVEQEQREQLQQANLEIENRVASEQEQRERLQRVLVQVRNGAHNLNSSAAEILAATTQQVAGATEQSTAITQATTTIDEVRAIAEQTAQRAQGVAGLAQQTTEVSDSGQQAVAQTIGGMSTVKDRVETIAQNILALSEQAQAVGQIIATVNEIAAQSNMLALNAAVEAARAGEAGKGFAVVAAEVRTLADQSRGATVQVKEILSEIQRGVNAAVMATEEGMKGTDAGVKLAGEAGLALQKLAESVTESTQAAQQIAGAAGQQLTGMEQIATAMESIHQVTAQSIAGTRQTEKAAEELNGLARELQELVAEYR